jgi:hypothetical protein
MSDCGAYLQGGLALRPTRQNLDTAQEYFELALEKEPNYALAYAGIARVWLMHQDHGWVSAREAGSKILAAADKALALDNGLAEVHHTLGTVKGFVLWDTHGFGGFSMCSLKGVNLPDKTACLQSPAPAAKGNAPVNVSYAITVRAHRSQRTSSSSPRNCSGDM